MLHNLRKIYREFKESDFFIYQMGKVGSTTLEKSIDKSIHFHSLYGSSPCYVFLNQNGSRIYKNLRAVTGGVVKRSLINSKDEVKIITLVREPMGRAMSMFFQDLPHWLYQSIGEKKVDTKGDGFDILFQSFYNTFDHEYFDSWFDKELKRFTGIDIFSCSFDKNDGYQIIEKGKFKIFMIKLECLNNEESINSLGDFCNQKIELFNVNIGSKKWYSKVYKDFKKNINPTEEFLDALYSTKTSQYFYSQQEITLLKQKYLKNNYQL